MKTIDRMKAGFRAFRAAYYEQRPERVRGLVALGQQPEVLLIACSDSRVDPAILMHSEPGELFVVRNVANIVPPFENDGRYHGTSAAIEYAVKYLKVQDIVIVGHSSCGGVMALVENKRLEAEGKLPPGERVFINPWMSLMGEVCKDTDPDLVSKETLKRSLENLMSFPFIAERMNAGDLALHGWWFDMQEGRLWGLDPETKDFVTIDQRQC